MTLQNDDYITREEKVKNLSLECIVVGMGDSGSKKQFKEKILHVVDEDEDSITYESDDNEEELPDEFEYTKKSKV